MATKFSTICAKLVAGLPPFVTSPFTLGDSRLSRWYDKNQVYRFNPDAVIALSRRNSFGYGIRPVGVVKGYTPDGHYIVEMEKDADGNFMAWAKGEYTPSGNRTEKKREVHFKWNIEHHFKTVKDMDPELAYA